jgi:hypothetical protein
MEQRKAVLMQSIKAREARAFLLALANTEDSAWIVRHFKKFFAPEFPQDSVGLRFSKPFREHALGRSMTSDETRLLALVGVKALQNLLRMAWTTTDKDARQWQTNQLRRLAWGLTVHPSVDQGVLERMLSDGPPPRDTLQQALFYFQSRAPQARLCANPECRQTRFFFADKPNRKYCSDICSEAARTASKKLWWDDHGTEWRKAQSKKKKGAKHGKRQR